MFDAVWERIGGAASERQIKAGAWCAEFWHRNSEGALVFVATRGVGMGVSRKLQDALGTSLTWMVEDGQCDV